VTVDEDLGDMADDTDFVGAVREIMDDDEVPTDVSQVIRPRWRVSDDEFGLRRRRGSARRDALGTSPWHQPPDRGTLDDRQAPPGHPTPGRRPPGNDRILCVTTSNNAEKLLSEFEAEIPTLDRGRVGIVDCSGSDSQRTIEDIAMGGSRPRAI